MVDLGKRYRDTATGYDGTATARSEYLGHSPTVQLSRLDNYGKVDSEWLPEGRLVACDPAADTAPSTGFTATPPDL